MWLWGQKSCTFGGTGSGMKPLGTGVHWAPLPGSGPANWEPSGPNRCRSVRSVGLRWPGPSWRWTRTLLQWGWVRKAGGRPEAACRRTAPAGYLLELDNLRGQVQNPGCVLPDDILDLEPAAGQEQHLLLVRVEGERGDLPPGEVVDDEQRGVVVVVAQEPLHHPLLRRRAAEVVPRHRGPHAVHLLPLRRVEGVGDPTEHLLLDWGQLLQSLDEMVQEVRPRGQVERLVLHQ
mmetsp:Transcript_143485/g.250453  ORF Transcript_143485/g.250453 Transcript_143485/m.250453 type:complete len:233 (+) Transcript_143485:169-867(+)